MRLVIPFLIAISVSLAGCGPAARGAPPSEAEPVVPPETAVHYAIEYARMSRPGPGPQLVGEPAEVRGRVMSQEESERFRPEGQRYWSSQEERDLPVWLVAIEGDFQTPGGGTAYRQGMFVLDAHTAQYMGSSHRIVGREVDASPLPVLTLPAGPVPTPFATYTPGPAPTMAPVATKPEAPPAPPATKPPTRSDGVPTTDPVSSPNCQGLPDFGQTTRTNRYMEILNEEAKEGFLAAHQKGEPGRWRFVAITIEGDPISYDLCYGETGQEMVLVRDSTRDKFGPKEVIEHRCTDLIEMEDGLRLLECEPGGEAGGTVRIPTVWGR